MTEGEWLICTDPMPMLVFLRGKASDRRLRLLACACSRLIWHMLTDERSRAVVELAERYAEGLVEEVEVGVVRTAASSVAWGDARAVSVAVAEQAAPVAAETTAYYFGCATAPYGDRSYETADDARKAARQPICALLRDIFAYSDSPFPVNSNWVTPAVTGLARAAYEERIMPSGELDLELLAVLSDALEEAGCDEPTILDHLRALGPHVRGCWVLDLLLGKS